MHVLWVPGSVRGSVRSTLRYYIFSDRSFCALPTTLATEATRLGSTGTCGRALGIRDTRIGSACAGAPCERLEQLSATAHKPRRSPPVTSSLTLLGKLYDLSGGGGVGGRRWEGWREPLSPQANADRGRRFRPAALASAASLSLVVGGAFEQRRCMRV